MKKLLLISIACLVGLFVLVVAVLLALPFITNLETVRNQVTTATSAVLQRQVTLTRLSLRAIPRPGLQIGGLRIAERDGSPIGVVDQIIVEVKLAPLLRRELVVDRVIVKQPMITLSRNADGALNLPLPAAPRAAPVASGAATSEGLPPITVALEEARIEDGEVTIHDHALPKGPPLVRTRGLDVVLNQVSLAPGLTAVGGDDPLFLQRLTVAGTVKLREGNYQTSSQAFKVEDLNTNIAIKESVVRLDGISVKLLGGKGSGTAVANLSGKTPAYETNIKLDALQMDKLYEAMGMLPGIITGTASTQEAITTRGHTPDDFQRTLTGSVRFEIKNGSIRKMDALGKILSVLNMKRLLSGRLPDVTREGVPFDSITGTLRFKNGLMTTENLKLQGTVLDADVRGTFNLPDKQVKMVVTALGTDFDVQGPADNPAVSSRAVKGITEGVGGVLEKSLGLFR